MSSKRKQMMMAVALLVAVAAIGAYAVRTAEYAPENALSATAKTPLGMNALFTLLKQHGINADYFGQALELLPKGATLVVGDDAPLSHFTSMVEREDYTEAARGRGNTVIYLPPISHKNFDAFAQSAGGETPAEPERLASTRPPAQRETLPSLPLSAKVYELPWEIDSRGYIHISVEGMPEDVFTGVKKLTGGGLSPYGIKPLDGNSELAKGARAVYYFMNTNRPFLVESAIGQGVWVEVNASELFTNRDIGKDDNAVFAYNLLRAHEGKGLLFLESIHGFAQGGVGATALLFFTWWGQLILLLTFCAFLYFLKAVFPLGKDIETPLIAFPSALERVRAQAELWRHGRHGYAALRYSIANALGLSGADATKQLAVMLAQEGFSPVAAFKLAEEMMGASGRRVPQETLRAYGRILRRHSVIRRYM